MKTPTPHPTYLCLNYSVLGPPLSFACRPTAVRAPATTRTRHVRV